MKSHQNSSDSGHHFEQGTVVTKNHCFYTLITIIISSITINNITIISVML